MHSYQQQRKKIIKTYKERRKYSPFKKKETEAIPDKNCMTDLLDRNFKTTALKILKEIMEDVEKAFLKNV